MKQIEQLVQPARDILKTYEATLLKWQKAVNLVSSNSLNNIWERHILDSAQLYSYLPENAKILVDMGSGAGFPALVIAVLNQILNGPLEEIYLIESDIKKCIFLRETARVLGVNVHVLNERLENIQGIQADVITSRALARIDKLIAYGRPFVHEKTIFLLPKGENIQDELTQNKINCQIDIFASQTDDKGCIVKLSEVKND